MDDHSNSNNQVRVVDVAPDKGYALSGKIMLSAIVVLFAVVLFMVSLHLYARWYLLRERRRQIERRRQRRASQADALTRQEIVPANSVAAVDRGLDITVLNSLPVFLFSPSKKELRTPPSTECAVCLSEFEDKEIVRLLPKCNHSFHIECIDMWFHSHSTCPLCRSPVEKVVVVQQAEKAVSSESGCSSIPSPPLPPQPPLVDRKKAQELGVRIIDVPPAASILTESEFCQSLPGSRLLALKRILSMGRKSPAARGAGTSRVGGTELDLESGMSESSPRVVVVQQQQEQEAAR